MFTRRKILKSGAALAAFRQYTRNALARIQEVEDVIYADAAPVKSDKAVASKDSPRKGAKSKA